jgi:hypothetical protein
MPVTSTRRLTHAVLVIGLAAGIAATLATPGFAAVIPGTSGADVHFGLDNDDADNPFIQPPGVPATLHMDDADVVFGREGNDLLVGNLGSDTIPGGKGSDIMIGGPDDLATPSSDVLLGDEGNDINIWAPGDGNDVYVGDTGNDAMVFAPLLKKADGSLVLVRHAGRKVPRVDISAQADLSCTILKIPPEQQFGAQFLVRFNVDGDPVASVRLKDVEQLLCPSAATGDAAVADLTVADPVFHDVQLSDIGGVLGAIVAAP